MSVRLVLGSAFTFAFLSSGFAPQCLAQTSDGTSTSRLFSTSAYRVHGDVGSESLSYPTSVDGRSDLNQNLQLKASLQVETEGDTYVASGRFKATKSINLNIQTLAVQELYAGSSGGQGFYFGRKMDFWNQADRDWNLGLWQPLDQDDTLRPIPQGLMGGFYTYETDTLQVLGFASPIFIPTMLPDIAEDNGQLISDNRWVRPFPSQITINGHQTQLTYRLNIPPAQDLVFQPAVGARVRFGRNDHGPWGAFALASKPINALSIKYDAAMVSSGLSSVGQASVVPVVSRHNIVSADFGWNFEKSSAGVSLLADSPDSQSVNNTTDSTGFATDYYQQQPKPLQLVALSYSSTDFVPWIDKDVRWTADYLKAHTDPTEEFDSQGIERSAFIPNRLLFTNAVSLQGEVAFNDHWLVRGKYLRDFDQSGTLVNLEGQYTPWKEWSFQFGMDALGVDDQKAQENDNRFLNSYRQNDRVYGGFAYVF